MNGRAKPSDYYRNAHQRECKDSRVNDSGRQVSRSQADRGYATAAAGEVCILLPLGVCFKLNPPPMEYRLGVAVRVMHTAEN